MTPAPSQPPPVPPGALHTLASLGRVLVVSIFLLTFGFQTYRIPSGSMIPTLEIGDFVLVTKTPHAAMLPAAPDRLQRALGRLLPFDPLRRGDLVVFHYPPEPGRLLVKRVIGLPGDRLYLRNGHVFLNDRPLAEPYTLYTPARPDVFRDEFPNLHETDPEVNPAWWLTLRRTLRTDGELAVPPGRFFVLGDNRNNSEDSRFWGFVPFTGVVGRPLLVYFSVPNGADAPEGGPLARMRWVAGWLHQRIHILH